LPEVQGELLVGVQTNPIAVPGGKPVTVLVAPTLPMTTEVPVFETLPPKSPKELAGDGIDKIGPPTAGITAAAAATNQSDPKRIFSPC
jgi:hypothetical protein